MLSSDRLLKTSAPEVLCSHRKEGNPYISELPAWSRCSVVCGDITSPVSAQLRGLTFLRFGWQCARKEEKKGREKRESSNRLIDVRKY
jgi:hypothetical protein